MHDAGSHRQHACIARVFPRRRATPGRNLAGFLLPEMQKFLWPALCRTQQSLRHRWGAWAFSNAESRPCGGARKRACARSVVHLRTRYARAARRGRWGFEPARRWKPRPHPISPEGDAARWKEVDAVALPPRRARPQLARDWLFPSCSLPIGLHLRDLVDPRSLRTSARATCSSRLFRSDPHAGSPRPLYRRQARPHTRRNPPPRAVARSSTHTVPSNVAIGAPIYVCYGHARDAYQRLTRST